MNAIRETMFTMEGFSDQSVRVKEDVKPSLRDVTALDAKRFSSWHTETVNNLYGILALDEDWDSYGASRLSPETAKAVTNLLRDIMQSESPAPQVVPSASGSIQVEWHLAGIDLEIEVESLSTIHVFFSDEQNEEPEWEGGINYDLSKLVHYVNLLTGRS